MKRVQSSLRRSLVVAALALCAAIALGGFSAPASAHTVQPAHATIAHWGRGYGYGGYGYGGYSYGGYGYGGCCYCCCYGYAYPTPYGYGW